MIETVIEIVIMRWVEIVSEREIERETDDVIETTLAPVVAAVTETLAATALAGETVAGCRCCCGAVHCHPMSMEIAQSSRISLMVEAALEQGGKGSVSGVPGIASTGTDALLLTVIFHQVW